MNDLGADVANWYVVQTHSRQEFRAEENLKVSGVETFLPKVRERQYKPFTNIPTLVVKPLFPRYLFARFRINSAFRKVCFTRGVHSVLSFGSSPVKVDGEIITLVQSRVGEDGLIKFDDELNSGDRVMISDGPLKTLVGVFQHGLKGSERVVILLTAISYQGSIVIEKALVRKIG
jgi:transcriptional antiterminator RfaH